MAAIQVGVSEVAVAPDGATPAVAVHDLVRRYGDVIALGGVTLSFAPGEFVSLLGPSGCGKTTLLRVIAGLERQDRGEVAIAGEDVASRPPHRRPVNLVFQRYALFPHKTVGENIAFSLMLKRVRHSEIEERVARMLDLVHLTGYGERRIDQLSGGQGQRVALARALIDDPPVLLLDEPLAALDLKLRQAMHVELREIQRRVRSTFVYVTHDQQEAFVLSDRVVLMHDGHVVQQGTPVEVYQRPRTLFAATFLGEANIFHGTVVDRRRDRILVEAPGVTLTVEDPSAGVAQGVSVSVCVRPERARIGPPCAEGVGVPDRARAEVVDTIFLGNVLRYRVRLGEQIVVVEIAEPDGRLHRPGDGVTVSWEPNATVLLED